MDVVGSRCRCVANAALLVGCSFIALSAVEANAQTSPTDATEAAPTDNATGRPSPTSRSEMSPLGVADIVVTAQKREENLQDVPIAVAAVTGETIDNLKAPSLLSLAGTVPSIQINHHANTPNTAVFYIRGIGIVEPDPYAGNTVSIVVDGVPQFFSMGALLNLFDIERVEILRGPQGTLFGANSTGGVVNVVTRQPTGEWGGRAELTYGNWNRFDANLAIDIPVVPDLLAAKLAVSHTERDGWIRNVVNGKDMDSRNVTAFRGYLKFTPAPNFDATFIGEYDRARNGSPVVVNGGIPGEALYVPPGTMAPGSEGTMYQSPCQPAEPCDAPDRYLSANDSTRNMSDMDVYFATLTMNWRDSPIGDVASVTGYKEFKLVEETDQDGTPLFLLDTRRRTRGWQLSQELRSSLDISDTINILFGGFFQRTHYDHLHALRVQFAVPGLRQDNPQDQDNHSISFFAQSYVDLTDQLRLQAGIRYSHEKTNMVASSLNFLGSPAGADFSGGMPLGGFTATGEKSWDNVGWKLGLDYSPRENLMVYGYWARGFKSGGFVGRVGIPSDIGPYEPEEVDTFEVGFKADWFDRLLRTNVALFYTDYRNMQLAQNYFAPDTGGGFVQGNTILNVASATIKGAEIEAVLAPTRGLAITGSLTYLDAKYEEFLFTEISVLGVNIRDLSGFRLQNAPRWAGSVGANYKFGLGLGTMTANILYNYTGQKYLTSLVNSPRSTIQPTHLLNGSIDWSPTGDRWSIGIWGRNLLDQRYIANVFDAPGTFAFVSYQPPREYGVSVKVNW